MNAPQHTPGDWFWTFDELAGAISIWAERKRTFSIAKVEAPGFSRPEQNANAVLMAAAPRMLKVLLAFRLAEETERQAKCRNPELRALEPNGPATEDDERWDDASRLYEQAEQMLADLLAEIEDKI